MKANLYISCPNSIFISCMFLPGLIISLGRPASSGIVPISRTSHQELCSQCLAHLILSHGAGQGLLCFRERKFCMELLFSWQFFPQNPFYVWSFKARTVSEQNLRELAATRRPQSQSEMQHQDKGQKSKSFFKKGENNQILILLQNIFWEAMLDLWYLFRIWLILIFIMYFREGVWKICNKNA